MTDALIRVMCVDDNRLIAEAMERRFALETKLQWAGWIGDTMSAIQAIRERSPTIVMLDIDMPGCDSFALLREISATMPDVRVLMFSGHIRDDYINQAVEGGAWGYVSKNEALEEILNAIRRIAGGEFVVTADVQNEIRRSQ